MNKTTNILKSIMHVLMSGALAGCALDVLLRAAGISAGTTWLYLGAAAGALLMALVSFSWLAVLLASVAMAGGAVAALMLNPAQMTLARDLWQNVVAFFRRASGAELALPFPVAALLGAVAAYLLYPIVHHRGTSSLALVLICAALIFGYSAMPSLSLLCALPGVIGAAVLLAWCGPVSRDMVGGWRALLPAVLAVLIALPLVPKESVTWPPLENAARTVRRVFEDYFHFIDERVPFTLYAQGYDHAREIDGAVVVHLGGPAQPSQEAALSVACDSDVLLRGSIYRIYTGESWQDAVAKTRYLYYDFLHTAQRDKVYNSDNNENLTAVSAEVQFLRDGSSALFIPTRTKTIEMAGGDAVYYNSIGETFLANPTDATDKYTVTGYVPLNREQAREAVRTAYGKDSSYASIRKDNTFLPNSIEPALINLVQEIVAGKTSPFDKAAAIEDWLKQNCTFTLTPEMPQQGRDFVSQFVLDSKEGYCSYYASAMTVMCRIAGLPARYVEGYKAPAWDGVTPVTLTGENAHAWTEVYFTRIGWIPFDPVGSSAENGTGQSDSTDGAPPEEKPEKGQSKGDNPQEPDDAPTPEPQTDDVPAAQQQATPEPDIVPAPQPEPERHDDRTTHMLLWLLLLLAILLLIATVAALWIRLRLKRTEPIALSRKAKSKERAAMILYRSILTLLAQMGQMPMNGETPATFAARMQKLCDNDAYERFVHGVTMHAYAGRDIDDDVLEDGREAYQSFFNLLRRREKKRFLRVRVLHGLGSFDSIP